MHDAQHLKREQRQVLEEAVEPAAAVQVLAVGERDFVVGHVVQLVVHVADGVDVDARGDQRHHAEHRDGQRVDVVADRELQLPNWASVYQSPAMYGGGPFVRVLLALFRVFRVLALRGQPQGERRRCWLANSSGCSSA